MNLQKSGKLRLVTSLLALAALTAACSASKTGGDKGGGGGGGGDPFKIGTIFPVTGPLASSGGQTGIGTQIAIDLINEKGGVCSRKITVESADAPDATAAVQEAERLISSKGVTVILGTGSSSHAIAASQVAERNSVFFWEVEGIADPVTGRGFKYTFRPTFSANQMSEQMLNFTTKEVSKALKKDAKDLKVAMIYEDSSFGTSTAKNVEAMIASQPYKLALNISYNAKSADLSSIVLQLKQAKIDVLLAASYVNDAVLLARQSKELSFKPAVVIGTTAGHGTTDFVSGAGDLAENVFAVGIPSNVTAKNMSTENKALYDELIKRYKAKYNKEPNVNVFNGFSGTLVYLNNVLGKACSTKADDLQKAALALDMAEGSTVLGYGVKFAPGTAKDAGQNQKSFAAMMQWQGGKLNVIYPSIIADSQPKF